MATKARSSSDGVTESKSANWHANTLDPRTIDRLISDEVEALIDHDVWKLAREQEDYNRSILASVHDQWERVAEMFGGEAE